MAKRNPANPQGKTMFNRTNFVLAIIFALLVGTLAVDACVKFRRIRNPQVVEVLPPPCDCGKDPSKKNPETLPAPKACDKEEDQPKCSPQPNQADQDSDICPHLDLGGLYESHGDGYKDVVLIVEKKEVYYLLWLDGSRGIGMVSDGKLVVGVHTYNDGVGIIAYDIEPCDGHYILTGWFATAPGDHKLHKETLKYIKELK